MSGDLGGVNDRIQQQHIMGAGVQPSAAQKKTGAATQFTALGAPKSLPTGLAKPPTSGRTSTKFGNSKVSEKLRKSGSTTASSLSALGEEEEANEARDSATDSDSGSGERRSGLFRGALGVVTEGKGAERLDKMQRIHQEGVDSTSSEAVILLEVSSLFQEGGLQEALKHLAE